MITDPYQPPSQASPLSPAVSQQALKETLFSFNGRIPRRTYWLWALASGIIFGIVIGILSAILGPTVNQQTGEVTGGTLFSIIAVLLYIPMIWIGLALGVKRWHDRGKSGWWILIGFIPLVGAIWTFVECGCLRGTVGPNQYGADPT